jgi:GntR family transcriptional regulator / MocR family aminotransferase
MRVSAHATRTTPCVDGGMHGATTGPHSTDFGCSRFGLRGAALSATISAIRHAILSRQLPGGVRLPSTRVFAQALNVSRNTVLNAVEQLIAEGYLEGRHGAGTFVASVVAPHDPPPSAVADVPSDIARDVAVSEWGEKVTARVRKIEEPLGDYLRPRPFTLAAVPRDQFPSEIWTKLVSRQWAKGGDWLRQQPFTGGYEPLRIAIAERLLAERGVRCTPDQIFIVTGCEQAVELAAWVLLNPGDAAWMEVPG